MGKSSFPGLGIAKGNLGASPRTQKWRGGMLYMAAGSLMPVLAYAELCPTKTHRARPLFSY